MPRAVSAGIILLLLPWNVLNAWLYWGELRFTVGLLGLPSELSVNTFDDDVPSESIERCFLAAGLWLELLPGGQRPRTYSFEDKITYPGVVSVVQYPTKYVELTAFSGNDSDGVDLRVVPGKFSTQGLFKVRELSRQEFPSIRYRSPGWSLFSFSPLFPPLCLCVFVLIFFFARSRPSAVRGGSGSHRRSCRAA